MIDLLYTYILTFQSSNNAIRISSYFKKFWLFQFWSIEQKITIIAKMSSNEVPKNRYMLRYA